MSDSDLNTSDDKPIYIGALFGSEDLWAPIFMDNDRNEYVFLYKNGVSPDRNVAMDFALMMSLDAFFLGVSFKELRFFEGQTEVPNVTCEAVSPITGKKYKVAILSGPAFLEHYKDDVATENDRLEYEARVARENGIPVIHDGPPPC